MDVHAEAEALLQKALIEIPALKKMGDHGTRICRAESTKGAREPTERDEIIMNRFRAEGFGAFIYEQKIKYDEELGEFSHLDTPQYHIEINW